MSAAAQLRAEPASQPHTDALYLRDATFHYPRGPQVLHIQELRLGAGERVFLHGPSGSGKTTLLSLIAGILNASSGAVEVLGRDFTRISASARDVVRGSSMGYIFQGFNLIPYLSTAENIALPCRLYPQRARRMQAASVEAETTRLAHRLDIATQLQKPVTELSVGQQQRVAIARALIGAPALLVADEPTSALDADRRDSFLALLTELSTEANSTLLFVSHDRSLARHFDRSLALPELNRSTPDPGTVQA